MRKIVTTLSILFLVIMTACQTAEKQEASEEVLMPPVAKIVPKHLVRFGDVRVDNYYWLNQRENSEVIAYLEEENAYTGQSMAHTEALQEELFQEIKGRIKEADESVPYLEDGYYYYTRYVVGGEYALHCRKKSTPEAAEEIMLDGNAMAQGHSYFSLRGLKVSSGNDILAYGVDTVGRRRYTVAFKNLVTGEIMAETIPDVTGNMAWANDNATLFYTKQDPTTLRSFQIYRHTLGTDPAGDALIYEEKDETFGVGIFKAKSKKYLIIASRHTLSSEYRYLDADDPTGAFKIFLPREIDHEYSIEHFGDHFFIRTNDQAENFKLMKTPVAETGKAHWEEVIPHRDDVLLSGMEIFKDYLVLSERKGGLKQIRILPWEGGEEHYLDFGEPTYSASVRMNPGFDTPLLRYGYSSLTTPNSVYDYDMKSRKSTLLKQDEVLGGFDSANYVSERHMAAARDGVEVPISLVYRKGMKMTGANPLLLYGYGSYGASMDARFRSSALSLIDRGFIYAIAHVRGGQEMGRRWYEDGKLLKKMNTFTDFIDCGRYLIDKKYTCRQKLFAMGGSAGGLLMGAVINLRPDLFRGVVAAVPFVDVVTTMLDDSIPLTTSEFDEWGDPKVKVYYDYMLSYSPYDNLEAKAYPNLLVTTGLHDSQVQYFEPAKWVAKLRTLKTDDNLLLLKTNMEAGHGGASGRFSRHRETAFEYAFLLELAY